MGIKFQQVYALEDGRISDMGRTQCAVFLNSVRDYPFLKITLEPRKKTRSINQNSYYFGVVVPMVQDALIEYGNRFDHTLTQDFIHSQIDPEGVHEVLKKYVGKLTKYVALPGGIVATIVGDTKSMTTTEFEDYIESVRAWAADPMEGLGIIIPLPNENLSIGDENVQPKEIEAG